jgi:hypothetical protein
MRKIALLWKYGMVEILSLLLDVQFDESLMGQWSDLLEIARSITFTDENDQPIWMYNPSGVYSVKSFYAIVNDPGIKRIHTPAIWNITVPP